MTKKLKAQIIPYVLVLSSLIGTSASVQANQNSQNGRNHQSSQKTQSEYIYCQVIKVMNKESGFQIGNQVQFTSNFDRVIMDDFSAQCGPMAADKSVLCDDGIELKILNNGGKVVLKDVAIFACH